ncbi:MAG TPA: hypothetical protein VJ203_06795 [Bacteroidales bacterium]|nr:hypothetical protein [Bacteroidales bacterium]
MKTLKFLVLLLVICTLTGCKYKREAEKLETASQNLTSQLEKSDSTLNEYLLLSKDIESRFDSILSGGKESGQTVVDKELNTKLSQTLTAIINLMKENEKRYQALRISANSRASVREKEITSLTLLIEEKDSVIKSLNLKIAGMNTTMEDQISKISDLTNEKRDKDETLDMMTSQLNTAYYIVGTEDDLRNKGVILKTGGFLGFLGRVNNLNPQLDRSRLDMIDIQEKKTFTLNTDLKNMEFITQHPSGSYEIKEGDPGSIMITVTDPEKFWGGSKYLVVVI